MPVRVVAAGARAIRASHAEGLWCVSVARVEGAERRTWCDALPLRSRQRSAIMSQTPGTHGSVGLRERVFVRLFDKAAGNDLAALKTLAGQMIGNVGDEASNDPDGEE